MQEEEVEEILILMTEKMLRMEQELKVLNEKRDNQGNNKLPEDVPTDSSKQIPITGL